MKAFPGFGPVSRPIWLFGALPLLLLTACATAQLAEEEKPSDVETVDIGYGTVDKDHVVGSVTTVQGDGEEGNRVRTLAEMLQGQVGVQVIEGPGGISVRIRGTNSFLGGQEPLWVIDGMVIQSAGAGLSHINSTSIESVTVLKDAGSTAIYGSRGANGVILIKMKRRST